MDRRTRTIVVVGVALGLASLASLGVYDAIKTQQVTVVPIARLVTVVATGTVPVGVLLTRDMVRVAGWPADSPVSGGFSSVDDVLGRGLTAGLVANEPVTESKLAPKNSGGGLPPTITPGMRAMSVKVNDVIGVAGFIVPGTRVDVVATIRGGQDTITRTVISNVQVLAAGTRIDTEKSRDGAAIPSSVVTLSLTPSDVERLALASTNGQIVLVLRNPLDTAPTETSGVRVSGLLGTPDPAPVRSLVRGQTRMVAPPAAPAPKPYTVEAIRGATRTQEIIKEVKK